MLRPVFKYRQFSVTFLLPTFFDVAILWFPNPIGHVWDSL